jgi:hypothetical protein
MVRAVAEEALALASVTLFLAMVAVWAQVLGVVWARALMPSWPDLFRPSTPSLCAAIKAWMPATSNAVLRTAGAGLQLSVRRSE